MIYFARPGNVFYHVYNIHVHHTGVVRSIDPVEKVFYIITPLPISVLNEKVNCLLRGALDLPQQIYMAQVKPELNSILII